MLGFDVIMRLQTVITLVTGVLTVVYIALVPPQIDWATVAALPAGRAEQVIGALVFLMTGFGLGWVNVAADYSRYLPRTASSRGRRRLDDVRLVARPDRAAGLRAAARGLVDRSCRRHRERPVGALTDARCRPGSSCRSRWSRCWAWSAARCWTSTRPGSRCSPLGLRIPRWSAAFIDGVIMVLGTIYVVFFADDFLGPFQGFLITLGVPVAAWAG